MRFCVPARWWRQWPFAMLAILMLPGCAPPGTYRKIRSGIRAAVERDLGPADRYDVDTSRDGLFDLRAGRISRVEVHGVNVHTKVGMTLDEVFLSAHDVRLNRNTNQVESARDAAFTAYLGETAVALMLEKGELIANPTVKISPDGLTVTGQYTVGPAPIPVTATGTVRITGPTTLEFTSKSVTAGGVPVPIPINRTLDISEIYKPLMLKDVTLEDGRAVLKGTIDWSKIE